MHSISDANSYIQVKMCMHLIILINESYFFKLLPDLIFITYQLFLNHAYACKHPIILNYGECPIANSQDYDEKNNLQFILKLEVIINYASTCRPSYTPSTSQLYIQLPQSDLTQFTAHHHGISYGGHTQLTDDKIHERVAIFYIYIYIY